MKNIILIGQCRFMRMALKTILDNKHGHRMKCLSSAYEFDNGCTNATILIHVTDENHSEFLVLMRIRESFWLRTAIFITQKHIAALMNYLSIQTLRFIDENASVGTFEREITERNGSGTYEEKCEPLSQAECTILRFAASGMSLTAIAFRTQKSIKTVSTQKIRGLRKL